MILAGTYLGVAEGIVLAIKAGLDVEQVVEALSGGAAQSWVLANRSGRMIANDYPLGFKVALHLKDLGIALGLADELGADLPVSRLCAEIERGLVAAGHARRRHLGGRPVAIRAAARASDPAERRLAAAQASAGVGVPSRSSGSPSLPA